MLKSTWNGIELNPEIETVNQQSDPTLKKGIRKYYKDVNKDSLGNVCLASVTSKCKLQQQNDIRYNDGLLVSL